MLQKAIVKRMIDDIHVEIEVQRQSACSGKCGSCGGCGAPQERIKAVAQNTVNAKIGDIVTIEGENAQILRMAAIVYTLPLVLFFVFFIAASIGGLGEGLAGGIGCLGIAAGALIAVGYNKKVKKTNQSPFTIVKIG